MESEDGVFEAVMILDSNMRKGELKHAKIHDYVG